MATFKPMVKSLFAENETFKNKVAILIVEAENYKDCVAALEKSWGERRILSRGVARDKQKKIIIVSFSGMTTRFNKQKIAEAQEKKAKGGLVSGLLSKKHSKTVDASKEDLVVTPPPTHSPAKHPASLTSSLEVIALGEETKKKKKMTVKSFLPTFWDDANAAALKAHEALSVDDLSPLMAKSSSEVMLSHIQKLVQVRVVGHIYFFFSFALFLLRKIFCRLWGSLCLSLENSWTWRRRWPCLSL